ncbi:hypothetical protein AC249_AIPGENE594 [Exaiptasia diaphana]|nr:hypothetical protein AC249_AIPGENE594 [Exaiptasia diaphana]
MSEYIGLLKKGIETGYIPPKITVTSTPEQIENSILNASIDGDSKIYAPFKNIPESFTDDQRKCIKEKCSLIDNKIKSSFKDLKDFLTKEYIPAARDTISCQEFPNGKDFYQKALEFHITCDLTPQQVHDIGIKEVARILERMNLVANQTGFHGGLDEFVTMLRNDKRFHFEKKEDLLESYKDLCNNQIQSMLKDYFKTVPKAEFEIVEVPPEAAPTAPAAFYIAPSEDGSRPGSFFLNTYKIEERDTISCQEFPNGKDFYQKALEFHITCDLTPQQVHDIGIKEVARIRERMNLVAKQTGLQGGLNEFVTMLRNDKRFYFEKKEDLLARYKDLCYNQIQPMLKDYFKTVPKAKFEIVEVPPEAAPTAPAAFYIAPSEDGSRPGSFFLNTYKIEERGRYEMVSLSLHEAVPGHHLQIALSIEQAEQPCFRKHFEHRQYYQVPARFGMNTAYMEV